MHKTQLTLTAQLAVDAGIDRNQKGGYKLEEGVKNKISSEGGLEMNWLDVVLVICLIISAFIGFYLGLISALIPLVGLMVGVVVAGQYYTGFAHDIFSSHANSAYIASFVIIVLLFLIAAAILTIFLHGVLKIVLLDWLNHLAGMAFGFIWGCIIAGSVLSVLLKHSVGVSAISDSGVAAFLVDKFPLARSFLPGDFDHVKVFFH